MIIPRTTAAAAGLLLFLAGCGEDAQKVVEPVRALKTITVTELASGQVRKFSGIVQATDTSSLSFEVGGNVKEVKVDLGAKVKQGQVLAVLDKQPYVLAVQAKEASLARSKADMEKDRLEFTRKKTLYKQKWVAKAAYDQALAAYDSAKSNVKYTTTQLNLAKRDLAKTVLKAPFDGTIAEKKVDPHVEVKAGQRLFEINATGALEVALEIPETVIAEITIGTPVSVSLPSEKGISLKARVTEVGTVAGVGNAFPVNATLINPPSRLRAGMTAEATFVLKEHSAESGYLVPIAAIAPGEETRQGYVFVFDSKTSTIKKTKIYGQGVQDNLAIIREGIKAGDVIAVAGVSFLYDGQKVKLMGPR